MEALLSCAQYRKDTELWAKLCGSIKGWAERADMRLKSDFIISKRTRGTVEKKFCKLGRSQ